MTYFMALRFIARDDVVAAGEPIECLSPAAVVMRAEALTRVRGFALENSDFEIF